MPDRPQNGSQIYKPDHATCENAIRNCAPLAGLDVHITTVPPAVIGPYTADGFTCPHGVTFWVEPTGDQIAQWARDGVE